MKTFSLAILATLICFAATVQAQLVQNGPHGWPANLGNQQQVHSLPPAQTYPPSQQYQPVQTYPVPGQHYQTPIWAYPQHPVIVTRNEISGINPYTGRYDTRNQQVENTYFDPTRNQSRQNGTQRYVNRPVYNQNGQIVGYERGYVWNNTYTGVEHKELKVVTDNGEGGIHEQERIGF